MKTFKPIITIALFVQIAACQRPPAAKTGSDLANLEAPPAACSYEALLNNPDAATRDLTELRIANPMDDTSSRFVHVGNDEETGCRVWSQKTYHPLVSIPEKTYIETFRTETSLTLASDGEGYSIEVFLDLSTKLATIRATIESSSPYEQVSPITNIEYIGDRCSGSYIISDANLLYEHNSPCRRIDGDLVIDSSIFDSSWYLSNLEVVTGNIRIEAQTRLPKLRKVGGDIVFFYYPNSEIVLPELVAASGKILLLGTNLNSIRLPKVAELATIYNFGGSTTVDAPMLSCSEIQSFGNPVNLEHCEP